ncbi:MULTISPECIES: pantetheine-phosphate adenylyltransferase [unclassified Synechococcus]|uniref:pantetheine-phosphate adenylyltransferase n=1 Tax=unclassified Synechococcus TaxID=2626047 RepID=UPI0018CEAB40|nr:MULTISPECIES: pantetheine-phosphate adenylyltransferase [unclassified Synechococcus]MCP9824030.1 pantetheine-phosphate adenylyltransferase [Synechococcus sp. EJ6-Ellesmere]MEA5400621.1 pantetheine-phosphate adenylyltransferase [Synechococcus sp. BA-124 BA4]QPN56209.1 pantetheine-phosphate adenylyltransferase [Synechococcus sp. CBW1107]CAK6688146.1 Phosphopantetheine adenylyltransferase [Synechococcus sp. CBW1107]CAK6698724.1 Phosphopantetheine adenylyltransferase [Synechococcus sp. CBW1107]
MKALYPGSFDPLTLGHLDLIERAERLFGSLVVAVLQNPSKQASFPLEQRLDQIRQATSHLERVEVSSFDGLTVDFARSCGSAVILRGLRAMSDFEFELQIAHTNRSLAAEVETLFLVTAAHHSFLSSSVVKEVARFGGDVRHMVPAGVADDLARLFNR